ncbi:MAG: hypothetical protein DRG78_07045 [Epsilonproteobacteria bacterium]|nr:MAG: hypothetical protein DRG78_07045 [Campylobacterota bacterium]
MYLFLNHFAFTEPKSDLKESDVVEMLENLSILFIKLKEINVDLIIHHTLSQSMLLGKSIREYIPKLKQNNQLSTKILISKYNPMCSDLDTKFEENEIISFGNCKEEKEKIDVLYSFLSCALFYKNPILTINSLCSKSQFQEDMINIICDNEKSYILDNYKLIPYLNVINKIKDYQKENLIKEENLIDNWIDYKIFINKNLNYVKVTDYCVNIIEKKYSYKNSYSDTFRKKVKRFNTLIEINGGKPKEINFSSLGLGTPESPTRFKKLKESHMGIKDFSGNVIELNWHEYILKDCRLYFEKEDNYISFVHYEKKID